MHTDPLPDESPTAALQRWTLPRRGDYARDATLWWDDWVPVATTGWGALFVIAPLLATGFVLRATRALRYPGRTPVRPDATGSSAP